MLPLLLDENDNLRVSSFNSAASVTLAVEARIRRPDGLVVPMRFTHTPNTARTIATSLHRLTEGHLLTLSARASSGAPRRGQCFVRAEIIRGLEGATDPIGTALQGYVIDTQGLVVPGSPIVLPTEGPGVIRSITGTDPAVNTEISETVPTNARWRLIALLATLGTDATVANRFARVILDDGANPFWESGDGVALAAASSRIYSFGESVFAAVTGAGISVSPLPRTAFLMGGFRIRTSTANLQAGDNWSAPQLLVEEWIED